MSNSIRKIENSGKLITLDDSSKWEVGLFDVSTSMFWLPGDTVTVSSNKMTKVSLTGRKETVSVTRKS